MDQMFVALDVEATGLEAGTDEIIEVAAVKFTTTEVLETFSQLVRPRHSLPLKITRLTGITPQMLADAPLFGEVAPKLAAFVRTAPIVGHSIEFDLRMLRAQGMSFAQPAYDTFELATLLMPRLPAYRLSALSAALGVRHEEIHRAMGDADATRAVFVHLLGRIQALDLQELAEINRITARMNWPLRTLFSDVERTRVRHVFVEATRPAQETPARPRDEIIPLKPTGDERPIDRAAVQRFFAPDGPMGRAFDGYEQREQQVQMAEAVTDALNTGMALMVEAGTGTGKGLAYLTPAAMFAAQRGERVVVSTNTINLQDQLFFKDIPALQRLMAEHGGEPPFHAALLKGRGNYLCLKRYKDLRRDARLQDDDAHMLLKVQLWLPSTSSGDRAELPFSERESAAWGKVNAAFDTCTGPRCPEFHNCFFFKARREAEAAHLLVVNHALLLADLVTEAQVLPEYNHVIVDEAHNLEEVATDQFSFSVDQARLQEFLDQLFVEGGARVVDGLIPRLPVHFQGSTAEPGDRERAIAVAEGMRPAVVRGRDSVYDCFNRLTAFVGQEANDAPAYDARLRLTPGVRQQAIWRDVEHAWDNLNLHLNAIGEGLGRLEELLANMANDNLADYDALFLQVQAMRRFCAEVRINVGHIILGGNDDMITWLTFDRTRSTLTLNAAPLSVSELLRAQLFEQKATTVLASATLSVGASFDYLKHRIGLYRTEELMLDSPFNYEEQSLLYIPDDLPEPNDPKYQRAIEQVLVDLAKVSHGRMLVLFTANNALRQTYRAIQEPLEEAGITVLGQGIDGSRRTLLERFKEFPGTVLLGTTSFWEGVDVVGDALSVLVIAKLPFSVPSDPIYAARSEGLQDPFGEYAVPQAILRFKQGFGRLIRSRDDRGIVVSLDKRLLTKKYGQTFLNSLPDTMVRKGPAKRLPELAERFLRPPR